MRKPNWTEEQCLMLAQLVEEHKDILKGKFGPGVTARGKKQIWERIAQTIKGSFPLLVRTSEDCEERWYVLQSKAREEIAAHKRESSRTGGGPPAKQLSQVAQTVFNIFAQSLQQRKGDRRHRKWATLSLERLIPAFCCNVPYRQKNGDGDWCPKPAESSTPSTGGVLQTKN
ncbi:hypothetical protein DPEC_G00017630 [Dallia pectoralis]|uniref:Uncharacterized protein n=1 Tax=Dallia pectoralis TaxID=75939 RepID=A0ACC2HG23_DALPE|nr:hypothetical protein DPEC_G00017630 [Dallia pectoralis]